MSETTAEKGVIVNADGTALVTTKSGKCITIKRPHVLAQYKLVEAIGDTSTNRVYLHMCIPLLWVTHIDGSEVNMPSSKLQVEALITRLDEEGIAAVSAAIDKHFPNKDDAETAKK